MVVGETTEEGRGRERRSVRVRQAGLLSFFLGYLLRQSLLTEMP